MGEPEQLVQFVTSRSLEFGIGGAIGSDVARGRCILTQCAPGEGGLITGPCRACTWIQSNSAATSATNTIAEGSILLTERYAPCARKELVHLLAVRTWFNINLIIHVSGPVWEHDKKLAFLLSLLIRCCWPLRLDHSFAQHGRSPLQLICYLRTHPQPPNSSRTHSRKHCVKAPDRHLDLARHAPLWPRFLVARPPYPAPSLAHFLSSLLSTEHGVVVAATSRQGPPLHLA
jgi:hypothetical protein